jgi:hypothetical protein
LTRYQTGEGDDATGGDDTVPEAAVAPADDDDGAIENLLGGGMAIPPELTTLLRCVPFPHTHTALRLLTRSRVLCRACHVCGGSSV